MSGEAAHLLLKVLAENSETSEDGVYLAPATVQSGRAPHPSTSRGLTTEQLLQMDVSFTVREIWAGTLAP